MQCLQLIADITLFSIFDSTDVHLNGICWRPPCRRPFKVRNI